MTLPDELLRDGAGTAEEADLWVQPRRDPHFILTNACSGQAAILSWQYSSLAQWLETWRQLRLRFSIPVGTRGKVVETTGR